MGARDSERRSACNAIGMCGLQEAARKMSSNSLNFEADHLWIYYLMRYIIRWRRRWWLHRCMSLWWIAFSRLYRADHCSNYRAWNVCLIVAVVDKFNSFGICFMRLCVVVVAPVIDSRNRQSAK